jgi:hypothetical protein
MENFCFEDALCTLTIFTFVLMSRGSLLKQDPTMEL